MEGIITKSIKPDFFRCATICQYENGSIVEDIGEYQNVNFGEVSNFFIASKSKIVLGIIVIKSLDSVINITRSKQSTKHGNSRFYKIKHNRTVSYLLH